MKLCVHCENPERRVTRPRGLCRRCYHTPGVLDMYPSTHYNAGSGRGSVWSKKPKPATDVIPASMAGPCEVEARILIYAARVDRGEEVFSERDFRETENVVECG